MKRLFPLLLLLPLLALLAVPGCKKDTRDINLNLSDVTNLFAPDDNRFVKLQPATSAALVFEWEQARAEDGSLVLYEVSFDKEGGDFSNPVYKVVSDGGGVQNRLTMSHKDLNRAANLAGIKSTEKGKLKWTVLASKGTNVKQSALSRTIEVERPAGFAEIPVDMYLTGDATEAGANLAQALKMQSAGAGIFEIYTSLKNGTYSFADRNSGSPTGYSISGTLIREGGQSTQTEGTKVYRITLDFNNAAFRLVEITNVHFWFGMDWNGAFGDPVPAGDKANVKYSLDYAGNGAWKAANKYIEMQNPGWGLEGRYKYRLTVNEGGVSRFEFFGSKNGDNPTPTAATPLSYWFLFPAPDNQWDNSYKLSEDNHKKNNDIAVYFQPGKEYYSEVVPK